MNSSLQKLLPKLSRFRISLESAVNAAWYFVFLFLVILILFSGLIFYQYGLGRIDSARVKNGPPKVYFEDELVRLAAKKIEDRGVELKSAAAKATGLSNPFR